MKVTIIPALRAEAIPPVAVPVEQCAWCWPLLHPECSYPEEWSSKICPAHEAWMDQQRARRARDCQKV